MKKLFAILFVLSLCLALGACSGNGSSDVSLPNITGGAVSPPSGEPSGGMPTIPTEPGDGLEGGYFNDYLDLLLIIDGKGGYEISGSQSYTGTYSMDGDSIVFNISGTACHAVRDSDGDILFDAFRGYFLSDWEKWGITEADFAA
ncbi:MAG: hypothetical protein ACI4PC_06405 [Oscillospiraceae bacterium]